jgi:putative FmdB family regulatory protein
MGGRIIQGFRPMTYEYLCSSCGHAWEAEQSISEKPLTTCPQCKTENAKRQVSGGAGFILKGGGWYADLYGSAPKKSADGASDTKPGDKSDGGAKKDSSGDGAAKKTETTSTASSSTSPGSSGSSSTGSKPPGASAA